MRDISIAFGGVKAVDHVTVDLYPGEVVGLLGHNGAGKSTLIKCLSGAYQQDSGEIYVNGEKADDRQPARRPALQHRDDLPDARAGRQSRRGLQPVSRAGTDDRASGFVDDAAKEAETRKIMGRLNPNFRKFSDPVGRALGRPAAIGGDRPRGLLQRAHPDHGRAHGGAWRAGDEDGRRPDPGAEDARASASS